MGEVFFQSSHHSGTDWESSLLVVSAGLFPSLTLFSYETGFILTHKGFFTCFCPSNSFPPHLTGRDCNGEGTYLLRRVNPPQDARVTFALLVTRNEFILYAGVKPLRRGRVRLSPAHGIIPTYFYNRVFTTSSQKTSYVTSDHKSMPLAEVIKKLCSASLTE